MLDLRAFALQENIIVKRDIEKAGTRYLLKSLLKNQPFSLAYTPENKPFLEDRDEHISISHSHNKLVVIMNAIENTGIDIELIRDKVVNIQHKFLSEKELSFANNDPEILITLWAAKEAMYKVYGLKEVEFIKHLMVEPFIGDELQGRIEMQGFRKRYKLIGEEIDGYKMVYVLHEL
jgi:4'-phosphopantetheinyl transferase